MIATVLSDGASYAVEDGAIMPYFCGAGETAIGFIDYYEFNNSSGGDFSTCTGSIAHPEQPRSEGGTILPGHATTLQPGRSQRQAASSTEASRRDQ